MAKKGKSKNSGDALASVFDFLFKEAKQKKPKIKPPKYNQISNSNILASQMSELMLRPGVYLNDAAFGALNNALNYNLYEARVGLKPNDGDVGRLRVRTQDLGKLFSNPKKYIDSVFANEKASQAWNNYVGIARGIDAAMALGWAAKNKIGAKESWDVAMSAGKFLSLDMKNAAYKKLAQNIAISKLVDRPDDAMKALSLLDKAKTGDFSEGNLYKIFSGQGGFSDTEAKNLANLVATDHSHNQKTFDDKTNPYVKAGYFTEGQLNIVGYRDITSENLLKRAGLIDPSKGKTPEEVAQLRKKKDDLLKSASLISIIQRTQMEGMTKASFANQAKGINEASKKQFSELEKIINNWGGAGSLSSDEKQLLSAMKSSMQKLESNANKAAKESSKRWLRLDGKDSRNRRLFLDTMNKEIDVLEKRYRIEMQLLQKNDSTGSASRISELREEIRKLGLQKKQYNGAMWIDVAHRVGAAQSMWNSVNANIIQGGLARNLLLGGRGFYGEEDLFDPSTVRKFSFSRNLYKKDAQGNKEFESTKLIDRNRNIKTAYGSLAYLYYLNPGTLLGNLVNGEIFAFIQMRGRDGLASRLADPNVISQMKADGSYALLNNIFKGGQDPDASQLAELFSTNPDEFFDTLDKLGKSQSKLAKYAKNLARFDENVAKLTYFFGFPQRMINSFNSRYNPLANKAIKDMATKFLTSIFKDSLAVDQFLMKSIGFRQLVQAGINKILTGLGASLGGPIGGLIVAVISSALTEVAMKIGKVAVEVFFLAVLGVIAVIFCVVFAFAGMFNPITRLNKTFAHITPGTAIQCVDYNPDAGLFPEPPDNIGGGDYPPNDSDCPLGFSPIYCTQGNGAGTSSYHQTTKAIDIGTRAVPAGKAIWYAPTNGKIIKWVAVNTCPFGPKKLDYGGHLEFQDSDGNVYVLLHVKALAPVGNVQKGRAVAIVQDGLDDSEESETTCWTGPHFHLHVKSKGTYQDSVSWYRDKLKCAMSPC